MGNEKINFESRTKRNKAVFINVPINELVLTPLTCSSIVNEIIKHLIYQKSQIPYPYNWLKALIDRRRNRTENIEMKKPQITAERYYRTVSTAFDTIENLMTNINHKFQESLNGVSKVLVLFGSTPFSPKEAYTIHCPDQLQYDHNEDNHKTETKRCQHKVLRKIFLCEEWLSAMETSITTMNMFILLQMKPSVTTKQSQTSFFAPNEKFALPSNVHNVNIVLQYDHLDSLSCCSFPVFDDSDLPKFVSENRSEEKNRSDSDISCHILNDNQVIWYQANSLFKGFKDCFVNKIPASDLW